METDRGAVLTIRAAARGVVDFREAVVTDLNWWRRFNVLVRAMARDDELADIKATLAYHLALMGNGELHEDSFKAVQEAARAILRDLSNVLYPWAATSADRAKAAKTESLIEAYKRLVGDPNDPEFRKKLVADYERQRAEEVAAVATAETEEQRIDRLVTDRDRQRDLATRTRR